MDSVAALVLFPDASPPILLHVTTPLVLVGVGLWRMGANKNGCGLSVNNGGPKLVSQTVTPGLVYTGKLFSHV